ncbi:hypothetical protein EVAR_37996_1 [Eumeta japonica]|uniref:Uncharacterized protein n=1 Tax=Eumeta variegata TaxID=151549 RepID=A0A4C1WUA6_EUMVA|nr:hypothetical protein EVAR_37996_1 [Eumeta japonica]
MAGAGARVRRERGAGCPVDPGRSAGPAPHRPPRGAIYATLARLCARRRPTAAPARARSRRCPSGIGRARASGAPATHPRFAHHRTEHPPRCRAVIFARRGKYPHIDLTRAARRPVKFNAITTCIARPQPRPSAQPDRLCLIVVYQKFHKLFTTCKI